MSLARDIADLGSVTSRLDTVGASSGALSNRNLIINGAMQVNQRGDQTGLTSGSTYGLDRFRLAINSHGTWSISQSSTTPNGFASSFKVDCTTADATLAAGDYVIVQHRLEAQNLQHLNYGSSSAKKVTLSFHVRSNVTGTYAVNLYAADSDKQITQNYTINTANTWEKKEITFDALTDGSGINNDNGLGMDVSWFLAAGSTYTGSSQTTWNTYNGNRDDYARGQAVDLASSTSNEWLVTGVQLEVGSEATPFEHPRSVGDELARCQRYFYRQSGTKLYYRFGVGFCTSTTNGNNTVFFPVPMRAEVSFSSSGTFAIHHGSGPSVSTTTGLSIDSQANGTQGITIDGTTTGLTAGNACQLIANFDSSAYIDYDAEL